MAILAAPYLEEKLPAQQGDTLSIPFTLNRGVGEGDIFQIQLKVKNISTNTVKMLGETANFRQVRNNQYMAIFPIPVGTNFLVGQFYKAQLAFTNGDETKNDVGDFSTVGIFKYTKLNSIKILDANTEQELIQFKPNSRSFIGQTVFEDITEKIVEYKFDIYDSNDEIFYSTGYLIHNAENNKDNNQAIDFFTIKKTLKESETYTIVYTIKTISNLIISSPEYSFTILPEISLTEVFPGKFKIRIDNENGYFSLYILFTESKKFSGSFKVLRADSEDNFSEWREITQVIFSNKNIIEGTILELFKDFTVKQGVIYKYALQQFSGTFFAKKMICNIEDFNGQDIVNENFKVNFEDILLFDGERQLKVKFNPKISSFKNTLLESKIDTMGSKYPFFFRNGSVSYKEFPISGLISYLIDENHFFLKDINDNENYQLNAIPEDSTYLSLSTDLTYENILRERDFKLEVLDWLNNGKEKLFRSPTEGNYIVRLMNISLSPNDTLGRMLHTFSATAYECAECNFEYLQKLNFIKNEEQISQDIRYETMNLKEVNGISPLAIELPITYNLPKVISAKIYDVTPETEIKLVFEKNESSIIIGYTGQYNVKTDNSNPLIKIVVPAYINPESKIDYNFYEKDSGKLIYDKDNNQLSNFKIESHAEQFQDINDNIIDHLIIHNEKLKEQMEDLSYIRIQQKLVDEVWEKDGKLFFDNRFEVPMKLLRTSNYYALNTKRWFKVTDNLQAVPISKPSYRYKINNDTFILNSGRIELYPKEGINNFQISDGLYADIYYTKSSYERSAK